MPLPTYVTMPPAPRRAPPIDLTHPGAWSETQLDGARVVEEASAPPPAASGMSALVADAEDADDQLEAIIHRRAVND